MRLLLFNLATDVNDPVLAFALAWVRRLAPHCEYIDIITMYRGDADLPANVTVYSAGRERGLSKPRRVANFYRHLLRLMATRRYDACFAHMMPLFAGMAGPLLSARGIRTVLWYTHRQRSRQLRLGMAMSWRVVSADATSFPYETDKLRVIGHGIDTDFYAPAAPADWGDTLVVQVGRLAAIKHQATTIQAVAGTAGELALIGGAQAGSASGYEEMLKERAGQVGMNQRCRFTGDLPAAAVRDWYRRATVAVNMSPVGLFDKAALESMACGVPTIVCNPAFAPLLGERADLLLTAGPDDVAGLRDRLERLFALPPEERAAIGRRLRNGVLREHSLDGLSERLLAVLRTGELPESPHSRRSMST
ncbi:MAG: glycosyltransferase family 4 protein [Chloroflexi bacterium]|nr:glycosyltransferase family 4 protein [Chloroflexota bacterium]